jgi:membrane protein DedA with SNARE-associated domain
MSAMVEIVSLLHRHGYAVLALVVFLEAVGLPVPASLALVAAGAAAAWKLFRPELVIGIALFSMLVGDTLLYFLGRFTGWALLGMLCRIALNPESCILRSAESFYRRGRTTLLFAKFIPGINTLAPPLAGSMRMPWPQFFRLDFVGAFLYTAAFSSFGFLFSGLIGTVLNGVHAVGRAIEWLALVGVLAYIGYRVYVYWSHRQYRVVPRVQITELLAKLGSEGAGGIILADVRSHGYYDPGAMRIKGSVRLEPNNLLASVKDWPRERGIYLYCT